MSNSASSIYSIAKTLIRFWGTLHLTYYGQLFPTITLSPPPTISVRNWIEQSDPLAETSEWKFHAQYRGAIFISKQYIFKQIRNWLTLTPSLVKSG